MIGDNCKIYDHVVADAGVIIGRSCEIKPLKHINKNIESKSYVM